MNVEKAFSLAGSPAAFAKEHFGWTPYAYQEEVMDAVLLGGIKRVAWVAGRRVGKTETTANIALQLAVKRRGTRVAIFAPSFKQACILSKCVKRMLLGSPFEKYVVVDKIDELRLRFGTDAHAKPRDSVIFTNSLGGKVRGEGADVLIVDESAFCNSEDYRNKALPFIVDREDAIVIHISTVYHEDDHFMDAVREYPKQPHGAMFRTPTRMKPGVTAASLEEERRSMSPHEFAREFECELIPHASAFDSRALKACLKDYEVLTMATLARLEPKAKRDYYLGVDWGKKQDRAVIAVVEARKDEKGPARLVFLQVYEPDPDNPRHYTSVLDDVKCVAKQVNARRVVVDEGEGAHQIEVLNRSLGTSRLMPYRFTAESRDKLVNNAKFLVEKKAVELPFEPPEVRKAFENVQPTDSGYEHLSRKTKDVFDAIVLALLEVGSATAREGAAVMRIFTGEPEIVDGIRTVKALGSVDPRRVWLGPEGSRYL